MSLNEGLAKLPTYDLVRSYQSPLAQRVSLPQATSWRDTISQLETDVLPANRRRTPFLAPHNPDRSLAAAAGIRNAADRTRALPFHMQADRLFEEAIKWPPAQLLTGG
jgi:hypothetical protein